MVAFALIASLLLAPDSGRYVIRMGDKIVGEEHFRVNGTTIASHVELNARGKSVEMDVTYETSRYGLRNYVLEATVNGSHQKVVAKLSGSYLNEEVYVDGQKKLSKSEKVDPPVYVLDNNLPSQIALLLKVLPEKGKIRVWVPQAASFVDVKVLKRGKGEIVDTTGHSIVTDVVTIAPGGYVRYDIYYRGDTMFLASALKGRMLISLNGQYELKKRGKPEYRVKKFSVRLPGGKVKGEFDLPDGEIKGVVMLIAGSGDVDRHEIGVFDDITDCLTGDGWAVARYDKPGTGKSFKPEGPVGLELLVEAAESVFAEVTRQFPNARHFVLGHSEGGEIALILASRHDVDGLMLLAAPASPLDSLLIGQIRRLMTAANMMDSTALDSLIGALSAGLDSVRKGEIKGDYVELPVIGQTPVIWLKQHMAVHPVQVAESLNVPVLLVYGEDDLQVPVTEMEKLERALKGHSDVVAKVLSGNTHFFEDRQALCNVLKSWLDNRIDSR